MTKEQIIGIRVTSDEKSMLKKLAHKREQTLSQLVTEAIRQFVEGQQQQQQQPT